MDSSLKNTAIQNIWFKIPLLPLKSEWDRQRRHAPRDKKTL